MKLMWSVIPQNVDDDHMKITLKIWFFILFYFIFFFKWKFEAGIDKHTDSIFHENIRHSISDLKIRVLINVHQNEQKHLILCWWCNQTALPNLLFLY